ncbi:hypothetical protein, partial [Brevibacillus sp. CF112]|uniref:hypothetical protein n=1 Tax=Brevibacillus sp. CF112 TaxID=1144311 RepID=UPI00054DC0A0
FLLGQSELLLVPFEFGHELGVLLLQFEATVLQMFHCNVGRFTCFFQYLFDSTTEQEYPVPLFGK